MFTREGACGACGEPIPLAPRARTCPECGKPILVRYDTDGMDATTLRREWSRRRTSGDDPGMWRFRELLPLEADEEPVSLGEGDTPLLELERLGAELELRLHLKDEGQNPTKSFKDRGLSAAVTRAVRDGVERLVIPSAGNAGAALAAYAARAGVPARVYVPADTPAGVIRRCRHYGAEVVEVDGLITDCGRRAAAHSKETGAFDVSTLREPYRLEGKKTMMLEIVESLGGRAPDAIVYPTGGGTGLVASWKVLGELARLGLVERRTRLFSVQPAGCAPIVRAWEAGEEAAEPWTDPETAAWGLRVPEAIGDFLILRALRESNGGAVAVSEREMEEGARELGTREGVDAVVEGGATLAALRRLRKAGAVDPGERVVLFNTGSLLVY